MTPCHELGKSLVLLLAAGCAATSISQDDAPNKFIAADNRQLQYTGRVGKNGSQVLWEWPGVAVAANLKCSTASIVVQVHISVPSVKPPLTTGFEIGKYKVLVNGASVAEFQISDKSDTYNVTLPATKGEMRSLEVVKNSELVTIPVFWSMSEGSPSTIFKGITIPDTCTLLAPSQRPARRLEFVGDSITCGFGNLAHNLGDHVKCVNPPGGWVGYEDFSLGFPTLISKSFKAEMHTQCISNVGITRNGNTLAKTTLFNMSHYLHRTLPTVADASLQWDYKSWTPDLAVVNLGTNDYDIAQIVHAQPTLEFFESKYTSFLVDYVSRYAGRLPAMLVACGPMTKVQCPTVAKVARNVQAAFPALKVSYLELNLPKLGGCIFHPDSDGDLSLTKQMSPEISKLTGWDMSMDTLVV